MFLSVRVSKNVAVTGNPWSIVQRSMSLIPKKTTEELQNFKAVKVTQPKPYVFQVELNRPQKFNALNKDMWGEIKECFENLHINPDCRAVVFSGAGKFFSAGNDLTSMMQMGQELAEVDDVARKGYMLDTIIKFYQDSVSSLEKCQKPVIAAVHSGCVGAGLNFISAADIRYASKDAWFQLKEVDIGMAADVGGLQRLPKAIGNQSLVRELSFTGRKMNSVEAEKCGLVSKVYETREELIAGAVQLAECIASKSPIAVQATKNNIVYSGDRTNQEGLDHIRSTNKLYLQSEDFLTAVTAQLTKDETPEFAKL